jgi:hypothetical protein
MFPGQPSTSAGQSNSSSTASATTALQEDVVEKQLIAQIHAAVLNVRALAMMVAGEPMTEKSSPNLNELVIACSALHDARAALGEHNAPRVAVSSALSLPVFVPPLPRHPLDPFVATTGTNRVSNSVAPPPLLRTSDETVDAELLAAAAAAALASDELTAATGIEDLENDDAPVSPVPGSSSSSLPPGTHVAGPRQALATAPTAQQATPPAPPASASNNP